MRLLIKQMFTRAEEQLNRATVEGTRARPRICPKKLSERHQPNTICSEFWFHFIWVMLRCSTGQTTEVVLPQSYVVKYLGCRDARGLWGIKHTRHPVDELVSAARGLQPGTTLPYLRLEVSAMGVNLSEMPQNQNKDFTSGIYPIESISYGVQDLVYTRVFAMIVVKEGVNVMEKHPFICHAFVCDSRQNARSLTLTLATAFQVYSRSVKGMQPSPKKFAIDLRSSEEIQAEMETPQDSEA